MKTQHTPTPWQANLISGFSSSDGKGDITLNIKGPFSRNDEGLDKIVKAVNCHDDLVKALSDCISQLKALTSEGDIPDGAKEALKNAL